MTKQEFMAISLPYGLKGVSNVNSICTLNSIDITDNEYGVRFGYEILTFTKTFFTPILRPLSDLTKEIEHKGDKFIPIVELAKISGIKYNVVRKIGEHSIDLGKNNDDFSIRFWYESFTYNSFLACRNGHYFPINQLLLIQKLIEWHFDIALLIGKREAININMLHQNPYA